MVHVVTLVAGAGCHDLGPRAARLARALGAEPLWLAPERAVDLVVPAMATAEIARRVAEAVEDAPIDHALQPRFGRRKRLIVADMESTVITIECIDILAARAGIGAEIAEITRRTILGELEFGDSLRRRVAMLEGVPVDLLEEVWREVELAPGAATLVATMRAHGAVAALVSGGFTWFTGRVAALAGFDLHRANELETKNGRLTGRLVEPVLDRGAKAAALMELVREHGLGRSETLAVGDGANDIAMLEAAGLGVAWRAVPVAQAAADATVRHGDLAALLYFQGYPESAFVQPSI